MDPFLFIAHAVVPVIPLVTIPVSRTQILEAHFHRSAFPIVLLYEFRPRRRIDRNDFLHRQMVLACLIVHIETDHIRRIPHSRLISQYIGRQQGGRSLSVPEIPVEQQIMVRIVTRIHRDRQFKRTASRRIRQLKPGIGRGIHNLHILVSRRIPASVHGFRHQTHVHKTRLLIPVYRIAPGDCFRFVPEFPVETVLHSLFCRPEKRIRKDTVLLARMEIRSRQSPDRHDQHIPIRTTRYLIRVQILQRARSHRIRSKIIFPASRNSLTFPPAACFRLFRHQKSLLVVDTYLLVRSRHDHRQSYRMNIHRIPVHTAPVPIRVHHVVIPFRIDIRIEIRPSVHLFQHPVYRAPFPSGRLRSQRERIDS